MASEDEKVWLIVGDHMKSLEKAIAQMDASIEKHKDNPRAAKAVRDLRRYRKQLVKLLAEFNPTRGAQIN